MSGQCNLLAACLTLFQRCLLIPDLCLAPSQVAFSRVPLLLWFEVNTCVRCQPASLGHSSVACGHCGAAHLELHSWDVKPLPAPRGTVSPGDILLQARSDR